VQRASRALTTRIATTAHAPHVMARQFVQTGGARHFTAKTNDNAFVFKAPHIRNCHAPYEAGAVIRRMRASRRKAGCACPSDGSPLRERMHGGGARRFSVRLSRQIVWPDRRRSTWRRRLVPPYGTQPQPPGTALQPTLKARHFGVAGAARSRLKPERRIYTLTVVATLKRLVS
jgi:hypothetical protein